MDGKTVIVTGANNGIGKETARELAKLGARVIMACRNMETGRKAREEIIETTQNVNVVLKKIDLSSLQSIRDFAEDIKKTESKLHVLIHNAGIRTVNRKISQDGLELTMLTNHYGPFLLTHLLIDLLKKSAPSRIVVVSSTIHILGRINPNEVKYTGSFFPLLNYCNSKFANLCFTLELSRRLKNLNITVNSLHPGLINTEIWKDLPFPLNWGVYVMQKTMFKTPIEGCKTTVYLASSTEVENVTGKYFVNCKQTRMNSRAPNRETTKKFFEMSEKAVNLTSSDFKIHAV